MISLTFIDYVKKRSGKYYKYYRVVYNFVSTATILPPVFYCIALKGEVLFIWKGYLQIAQIALLFIAIILFVLGATKYDVLQVMGIRQIRSGKSHTGITESGKIDTSGILSITRHPWYLATMIFIWVWYPEIYVSTLIVNTILTLYLIIGTILEERKLVIELGNSYRQYKKHVSMLFPVKWIEQLFNNLMKSRELHKSN